MTKNEELLPVEAWTPDIVLYHANCADGFGAAWACWTRWRDACTYVPASYGQTPPDVTGKNVLIVDFSYKRDVLREMSRAARSIIVLDHHKTAQADLNDWAIDDVAGDFWAGDDPMKTVRYNDDYVGQPIAALFDMDKSGARLAWEFCHDRAAPTLIRLIEDRDLWRFTDDRTKRFGLWLRARPFDFDQWELIAQQLEDGRDGQRIMDEAEAMQTFNDQAVSSIASRARTIEIAGYQVPAVDCPPMFASEVCHELLIKHPDAPFSACYSDNPNGERGWSLRSQDGREDVSKIAASFGGGGHRNASGFGQRSPALRLTAQEAKPAPDEDVVERVALAHEERVEYEVHILSLEMELMRVRRVLTPLATRACGWEQNHSITGRDSQQVSIRLGDLRNARSVLQRLDRISDGKVERPFAYCCAEGGGHVDDCDCVNKDHGTAWFDTAAPKHPAAIASLPAPNTAALVEALELCKPPCGLGITIGECAATDTTGPYAMPCCIARAALKGQANG